MTRFFKDTNSSNIFNQLTNAPVNGDLALTELIANTTDAAQEKHVPEVTVEGNRVEVCVGSVIHPMLEEHFITGIYIETEQGSQYKALNPGEEPKAVFLLTEGDRLIAAYENCNLHGLWKKEL
ncbi:desulfoferrodoxin family protein [Suipraeoptans intestinalis]|uniref:desulfoferrodoxin family protein n=1 Tax=Suipraeoptans intestinalis TaxID=2606628 RepID=UPI0023F308FC|nr:desulfoferrodoxin family protein [Suipraeoptans intestinalis]MDD7770367.1 desulfoferrodoxin family protein [Suipraeoptans intestinalis]MDY3121336.1 desulfoferrodoxin family protein [Suipraeoptans intestinalis]